MVIDRKHLQKIFIELDPVVHSRFLGRFQGMLDSCVLWQRPTSALIHALAEISKKTWACHRIFIMLNRLDPGLADEFTTHFEKGAFK